MRRLDAFVAAVLALVPGAAFASGSRPRLVSPATETVVHPGERVEIAVADAPLGAEEWEAFLSLDGGVTYPLRATPHLPAGEPSFAWTVPALAPGRVRVKVRFGVAGTEHEFFLAETFSIGTGDSGTLVAPDPRAIGAGPAAGEGDTVAWVDRSNGGTRLVVPVPERGLAPTPSLAARLRAPLAGPKRTAFAAPDRPATSRLVPVATDIRRPAPLGRTIASLSRLNV
ncbi:MAG TPA: hypothetical protein VFL12_02225 [Thermoanaerobaculia bacterium]|nr:hypothetical protein [Thermoanaerobaculia bacterium]